MTPPRRRHGLMVRLRTLWRESLAPLPFSLSLSLSLFVSCHLYTLSSFSSSSPALLLVLLRTLLLHKALEWTCATFKMLQAANEFTLKRHVDLVSHSKIKHDVHRQKIKNAMSDFLLLFVSSNFTFLTFP